MLFSAIVVANIRPTSKEANGIFEKTRSPVKRIVFVIAANVMAIIIMMSEVLPGVTATSIKSPDAVMSVCIESQNAPLVLAVIEIVCSS